MTSRQMDEGLQTYIEDRDQLITVALRIVNNRAVAEELVQESWFRWDGSNYPTDKAAPIFRRIVKNLALDWYRRSRHERAILSSLLINHSDPRDAERVLMARQDILELIRALEELDARVVCAFRMHRLEHLTMAQIARELDTVPSVIHKYLVKALVHITARLDA